MELIKSHKSIQTAINGLGRRVNGLDEESHRVAVSAITHALEHNRNWELVTSLVKVMGGYDEAANKFKSRSVRATDLRNWVVSHIPVKWEYKDGKGRYVTCKKKLALFNEELCLKSLETPWYIKIKDEGAPVKLTSIGTRVSNLVKAVQKDIKKFNELSAQEQAACGFDTKVNDELIQQLLQVVNIGGMLDEVEVEAPANDVDAELEAELKKAIA